MLSGPVTGKALVFLLTRHFVQKEQTLFAFSLIPKSEKSHLLSFFLFKRLLANARGDVRKERHFNPEDIPECKGRTNEEKRK
jgi:hypothetical protein